MNWTRAQMASDGSAPGGSRWTILRGAAAFVASVLALSFVVLDTAAPAAADDHLPHNLPPGAVEVPWTVETIMYRTTHYTVYHEGSEPWGITPWTEEFGACFVGVYLVFDPASLDIQPDGRGELYYETRRRDPSTGELYQALESSPRSLTNAPVVFEYEPMGSSPRPPLREEFHIGYKMHVSAINSQVSSPWTQFHARLNFRDDYFNPDGTCGDNRLEEIRDWHQRILNDQNPRFWTVGAAAVDASFDHTVSGTVPGQVVFESTSTHSHGEFLTHEWDLGDGTQRGGTAFTHRYELPGDYAVTLRVTDPDGVEDTVTQVVEIAAPELGLAFSYPDRDPLPDGNPDMSFALDDEITLRVHLRASSGVGALSGVEFVGDALRSAPTTAWEFDLGGIQQVGGGSGDGGPGDDLVLEPGDEVAFDVPARAVEPGRFSFLSQAVALDAAGRLVGPVELERGGRIGELDVEVTVEPDLVELEEDSEQTGPVPEPVTVTVEVTNPFDAPLTDVVVEMNAPRLVTTTVPPLDYLAFSYLVRDPDDPGTEPVQGRPDEVQLGDLGPGESLTHEFEGLALNRGDVVLRALVRASYDGRLVAGVADGALQIATDVHFVFDAQIDPSSHWLLGGEPWVDGGDEWRIEGSFENRTHDETFEVVVLPIRQRNAGLGIPRELLDPAIGDDVCVMGVTKLVEPGETIEWTAPVVTSPTGATRSEVHFAPQVFVVGNDGSRAPLADQHVLVTTGSDEHLMRVDTRDHPPVQPGVGELVWTFSVSAAETFEESFIGLVATGAEMLELGLQPWQWPAAYQQASDRMVEYLHTIYENLSPADRAAWLDNLALTVVLSTGMALTDANDLVNAMALESFTELNEAWVTGDWQTSAAWMGRQVGANPDVALGALVKTMAACKLVSSSTPWARNALLAKEARIADELAALGDNVTAANIPTGAKVSRELRRTVWGIDDVMYAKVQAFVDEFGITIGVRRRGPGSIAKIEAGTHNPKPFHNKGKNTSTTDRDYLGFIDDLDTAAIKQPPPVSELRQQLAGAPADVRASVLARHRTRTKEWYGKAPSEPGTPAFEAWLENGTGADFTKSERYKWGQYAVPIDQGGGIPVPKHGAPLDYRTNVSAGRALPSDDALYRRAPARIRTEVGTDGRPQMILETDRGNGFKPDTGDMDPLVVTKADLSALPEAKRIEFYHRAHELGFEHVESASWNDPAGRNAYLLEHAVAGPGRPQGEAMFQWMPNSDPRATRFDPQRSWHDPNDELNAARFFIHGADVYLRVPDPAVSTGYVVDDSNDYAGYIGPKSTVLTHPDCPGADGPGPSGVESCEVVFDRGPDAIVFGQDDEGGLHEWSEADGWADYELDAAGDLPVLPQSVLTEGAESGDERIEIASADDLDLVPGVDDWFAVGDEVVIDPGGPREEHAVVAGFGSLVFTAPLQNDHAPGTMVSVTVPWGDPRNPADPSGPWGSATGDGGTGGVGSSPGETGTGGAGGTGTDRPSTGSTGSTGGTGETGTGGVGSSADRSSSGDTALGGDQSRADGRLGDTGVRLMTLLGLFAAAVLAVGMALLSGRLTQHLSSPKRSRG